MTDHANATMCGSINKGMGGWVSCNYIGKLRPSTPVEKCCQRPDVSHTGINAMGAEIGIPKMLAHIHLLWNA